jgi:tetratricopeptide (TPR) repeat protein
MNPSIEETISRADALYDKREDLENVRASVPSLQEAVRAGEYEALWRLGRALFFLGQEARDKEKARLLHARALPICKRAAQREPLRVEGHFWLGVNQSLLAQAENPLKALRHAASARRSLRRAVRINAAYHGAGPLRVLARLQHKLPRLLGGGRARARSNFERAIELEPANTVTRLYFAELLLETGDTGQARLELNALLNAQPDDAWAFEQKRDRQLARKMLGEL